MSAAGSASSARIEKNGAVSSRTGAAARSEDDSGPRLPASEFLTHLAVHPRNERVRGFMARLFQNPPQVLLLEGGTVAERTAFSLYWACLLNCEGRNAAPCFTCDSCRCFLEERHHDFFLFDGRAQSIKIDDLRAIRTTLGEPPRHAHKRVVLLLEAQSMGIEAANSQLKILEEPRPGTCFVLTAPQRERLLPTLVSRSWVLTLAWPRPEQQDELSTTETFGGGLCHEESADTDEWRNILGSFLRTGKGLLARTSVKGALDKNTAVRLVTDLQKQLARAMLGSVPADHMFSGLDLYGLRRIDETLHHCLESLEATVNPALCIEWLATGLYASFQGRKLPVQSNSHLKQ